MAVFWMPLKVQQIKVKVVSLLATDLASDSVAILAATAGPVMGFLLVQTLCIDVNLVIVS